MSETPNKKRGRKPIPAERHYKPMNFKLPPELADDVRAWIPAGERAAIVQECLKRAVAAKKRAAGPPAEEN